MNDINLNNSSCDFEGDLIGYLYNEATVADKRFVEQHLTNCDHCKTELAAMSSSRSAVSDWYSSEFVGLPLPKFVLTEDTRPEWPSSQSIWAFLGGWRPAAFGMAAAVLVVMGTVYFLQIGAPAPDVAVETVPAVTTSPALKDLQSPEPAPSKVTDEAGVAPGTTPPTAKGTASRAVTMSNSIGPRGNAKSPIHRQLYSTELRSQRKTPAESSVAKRKTSSPNLSGFEEKEDETLRLDDLFAEIDAG